MRPTERPDTCWVFSSQVNAWSLRAGLALEGRPLKVHAADDLLRGCPDTPRPGDLLFFTEEQSQRAYLAHADKFRFWPRDIPLAIHDDKRGVERLAKSLGIPVVASLDATTAGRSPSFPCLLKAAHSWRDGRKLPRGWLCSSVADLERARAEIRDSGYDPSQFFAQEWLGPDAVNISVCGFFDAAEPARTTLLIAERRENDRPGLACSAVVEVVTDPGSLREYTQRLLQAIAYRGPFELEFLVNAAGQARMLELNTRFWLQHGLFVPFGNGVIRRYLGIDEPGDGSDPVPLGTRWINGLWLARLLLRGRWIDFNRWIRPSEAVPFRIIAPSLLDSIRHLIGRRLHRRPILPGT